jgi:hypothetical protein
MPACAVRALIVLLIAIVILSSFGWLDGTLPALPSCQQKSRAPRLAELRPPQVSGVAYRSFVGPLGVGVGTSFTMP